MHGLALRRDKLVSVLRVPGDSLGALALLTGCDYSPMASVDLAWLHGAMQEALLDHARWDPGKRKKTGKPAKMVASFGACAGSGSSSTDQRGMSSGVEVLVAGKIPGKYQGKICNAKQALELTSAYLRAFWPDVCSPEQGIVLVVACLSRAIRRHEAIHQYWTVKRSRQRLAAERAATERRTAGAKHKVSKHKHRGRGKKRRTEQSAKGGEAGTHSTEQIERTEQAEKDARAEALQAAVADSARAATQLLIPAAGASHQPLAAIAIGGQSSATKPDPAAESADEWLLGTLRGVLGLLHKVQHEYTGFGSHDLLGADTSADALSLLCKTCDIHESRVYMSFALPALVEPADDRRV